MELFDAPSCFVRLADALWPAVVAGVVVVGIIGVRGVCRRKAWLSGIMTFGVVALAFGKSTVTQWQLGLLESESPVANERAMTWLGQNLTPVEMRSLVANPHEHPNVRFGLATILWERGEISKTKPLPSLQRPSFLGNGHLAEAAQMFEFPLEMARMAQ